MKKPTSNFDPVIIDVEIIDERETAIRVRVFKRNLDLVTAWLPKAIVKTEHGQRLDEIECVSLLRKIKITVGKALEKNLF